MMKLRNGYSMVVLIIAITVIIILASTAISVLQISREQTTITDFIFDITTVQEEVQNYYSTTGSLPIQSVALDKVNIDELNQTSSVGILSQLHVYDNDNYYNIDLSKIGTMALKDSERGYIVNEGSLKVYVKNGVEYSAGGEEKKTYYTLTSTLVNGLEEYVSPDEEILVIGNPVAWCAEANLRVVVPRQSLSETDTSKESWDNWTFKWDFGPKSQSAMEDIDADDNIRNFKYGDTLKAKSNGVYTIYVKDANGKVTIMNVNVTKIDDIKPTYKFLDGEPPIIQLIDNETGIKTIKYKTLYEYNKNVEEAKAETTEEDLQGRTEIDYFLYDGQGKDLLYDLQGEINNFRIEYDTIIKAIEEENESYNRWDAEKEERGLTEEEINDHIAYHNDLIAELDRQLANLYEKYPYIYDIYGLDPNGKSRLVLYVEDIAGNAIVVGTNDFISTEIIAGSYNIDTSDVVDVNGDYSSSGDVDIPLPASLKVGDYVNYVAENSTSTEWRVWELDEGTGEVRVIPTSPLGNLYLDGANDWLNAESTIDNECKKYINTDLGVTAANIRSLRIEDIEAHIDATQIKESKEYNDYGTPYQPTNQGGGMLAKKSTGGTKFDGYNEQIAITYDEDLEVVNTYYYIKGPEWDTINSNASGTSNYGDILGNSYSWLASRCVGASSYLAGFYVRGVYGGRVDDNLVWDSNGMSVVSAVDNVSGVRPLVSLSSTLFTGEGEGTSGSPWKLNYPDN